jgi:hypothetical protein
MNTIQINTADGIINYTEAEVIRFLEKAKQTDELLANESKHYATVRDIRNNVRDFFSESEWEDNQTTSDKSEVNFLLERIGCSKLTTKYRGTFTVTGTFSVDVEDEDEVTDLVSDGISVDFYGGNLDVEQIEVLDIEEDN